MIGWAEKMNAEEKSYCYTEGYNDWHMYKIPIDENGNNLVTGENNS
jgi:hypothetical protein